MISQDIVSRMRGLDKEFGNQRAAEWDAVTQRKYVFFIQILAEYMDRFWAEVHQMNKLYSVTRWKVLSHGDTLCCVFALGCDHPGGMGYAKFRWRDIRVLPQEV